MTTSSLRRTLHLALFAALALALPACLIHSDSKTETTGRQFSEQTFSKVKPGNNEGYVLALLGEPSAKTPKAGGNAIWKWEYTEVSKSGGSVFLVLSADSRKVSSGAVYVEFEHGVVASTWRD